MQPEPNDQHVSDVSFDACGRLRELFDAVTELPSESRSVWLDAQSLDPRDRVLIDRLLSADASAELGSGVLDVPVSARAARIGEMSVFSTDDPEGLTGELIGAFRIVREIGRGGMATVFSASAKARTSSNAWR